MNAVGFVRHVVLYIICYNMLCSEVVNKMRKRPLMAGGGAGWWIGPTFNQEAGVRDQCFVLFVTCFAYLCNFISVCILLILSPIMTFFLNLNKLFFCLNLTV